MGRRRSLDLSTAEKRTALALLLGAIARLYPVSLSHTPIHDGGLFYAFSADLLAQAFHLPLFTRYNAPPPIPFGYPPLGFYLAAILEKTGLVGPLNLFRWLPPLLAVASLIAFTHLSHLLLPAESASWAVLAYALAPQAIGPQIMGGGLSRALGASFAFLFLAAYWRTLHSQQTRLIVQAGLFGGLLLLSHLEWSLHAFFAGLLFWSTVGQSRTSLKKSLVIAALSASVAAPWWWTVLHRHGPALLQGILQAKQTFDPHIALRPSITGEIVPVLSWLALGGIVLAWRQKRLEIALLPLIGLILEPRSFVRVSPLSMALTAGLALAALERASRWGQRLTSLAGSLMTISALVIGLRLVYFHTLSHADLAAMRWVKQHTPAEALFLLSTPQEQEVSPALEWFPALADRPSLLTAQGSEWQPEAAWHYARRLTLYRDLHPCWQQGLACLETWQTRHGLSFSYVYISTAFSDFKTATRPLLVYDLENSPHWQLAYANSQVSIYRRLR